MNKTPTPADVINLLKTLQAESPQEATKVDECSSHWLLRCLQTTSRFKHFWLQRGLVPSKEFDQLVQNLGRIDWQVLTGNGEEDLRNTRNQLERVREFHNDPQKYEDRLGREALPA